MGASVAYPVLQEEWKEIQEPLAAGSQISGEITASSDSRSDNVHGHGAGGDTLSMIHAGSESSEFADDGAYTFNEHESGGMAATNANSAAFDVAARKSQLWKRRYAEKLHAAANGTSAAAFARERHFLGLLEKLFP